MTPEASAEFKKLFKEQGRKFKICEEGSIEEVQLLLLDPSAYVRKLAGDRLERIEPQGLTPRQVRYIKGKRMLGYQQTTLAKGWSNTPLYKVWKIANLCDEWKDIDVVVEWAMKRGLRKNEDTLKVIQKRVPLSPNNCVIVPRRFVPRKEKK